MSPLSGWLDLNQRPPTSKVGNLPTDIHPEFLKSRQKTKSEHGALPLSYPLAKDGIRTRDRQNRNRSNAILRHLMILKHARQKSKAHMVLYPLSYLMISVIRAGFEPATTRLKAEVSLFYGTRCFNFGRRAKDHKRSL